MLWVIAILLVMILALLALAVISLNTIGDEIRTANAQLYAIKELSRRE